MSFLMVSLALLAAPVAATDAEVGTADVSARVYPDGNILLVLGGTDLSVLAEIEIFDLSTADASERPAVVDAFYAGRYDGLFLGVPAETDRSSGTCDSLAACARHVNRVCRSLGSTGKRASIRNGCTGSCDDGLQIVVVCDD